MSHSEKKQGRAVGSRCSLLILCILVLIVSTFPDCAEAAEAKLTRETFFAGFTEQKRLRLEGRYEEALSEARRIHSRYAAQATTPWWSAVDMENSVRTLELIASLPIAAQQEMRLADSLRAEAAWFWITGKYSEGAQVAEERMKIVRKHLGSSNSDYAESLYDLARCLSHARQYARAEPLLSEAIEVYTIVYGRSHLRTAGTLEYLGELYASVGDSDRADEYYTRAHETHVERLGYPFREQDCGDDIIRLWARMAKLRVNEGDYATALSLLRRGLACARTHWDDEIWLTAMLSNDLAVTLWRQGDYASAVPLLKEALTTRRRVLGDEHPHVAQSLSSLGVVLSQSGESDLAESLLREVLDQFKDLIGEEHPYFTTAQLNLATLMRANGDYASADSLGREVLDTCQRRWGVRHLDVAECLHHLAVTQMAGGEYEQAEEYLRGALDIRGDYEGKGHPDVVQNLHDLGLCLLAQDRPAEAEPLLREASTGFESTRLRAGRGYARAAFQESPYEALAAARLLLDQQIDAWSAVERARGRALADLLITSGRRDLSPKEKATEDSLQWALSELEVALTTLREFASSGGSVIESPEFLEVRRQLAHTEADWVAHQNALAVTQTVAEGLTFTLQQVQNSLARETAVIGWLHLETSIEEPLSWAYVIRSEGPVRWIRLGKATDEQGGLPMCEQIRNFRESLAIASSWGFRTTDVDRIIGHARRLGERWVDPLLVHLDGMQNLIVIPSGPLLGIPIESLVDEADRFLGDRYRVSYTPSATIYAWLSEQGAERGPSGPNNALLVGDPPFCDEHLFAMEDEHEQKDDIRQDKGVAVESLIRGANVRSALAGNENALGSLPRLPWTRQEVELVASVIPATTILIGPEASEQRLTELAESDSLRRFDTIHLATHALANDDLPERSALVLSRATLPDPYEAVVKGTRVHDGLITAKEIVCEWELDADLITLSGCQTGLGRETAGEGYVGLAHAFFQVGARSLLVSLWKVEEEATTLLMGRFYENLAGAYSDHRDGQSGLPMSGAAALREAKRWLRGLTDDHGARIYSHPSYWSGFVLIGKP